MTSAEKALRLYMRLCSSSMRLGCTNAVSKTCAEAFKGEHDTRCRDEQRLYMLCSGECAAHRYPERKDHGKPRVGGYQHQKTSAGGG
jgi:hypothetical protein